MRERYAISLVGAMVVSLPLFAAAKKRLRRPARPPNDGHWQGNGVQNHESDTLKPCGRIPRPNVIMDTNLSLSRITS